MDDVKSGAVEALYAEAEGAFRHWEVTKDPDHHYIIKLESEMEPYIEFEYRGLLYAIEFVNGPLTTFTLTKIAKPTLQLKPVTIRE